MKIIRLLVLLLLLIPSLAHAQFSGADMYNPASSTTTGGGGSTSLSALTSATGTNTIDNTLFVQTWQWGTLTTQTAMSLTSSTLTTGKLFDAEVSNASSAGYAGFFSQTATSTGWAIGTSGPIDVENGNYRIGNLNAIRIPDNLLDVTSIGVGHSALGLFATTSGHNTAVGVGALAAATTALNNTALGYHALTLSQGSNGTGSGENVAVGSGALGASTSGWANVAVGYGACDNITTTQGNVCVGHLTGTGITTSSENTFVGSEAGDCSQNTTFTTALGSGAQMNNCGSNNTAIGGQSLKQTSGTQNTALGEQAGQAVTSGADNTLIGYAEWYNSLTTGSNNIAIGTNIVQSPLANTSSALVIGPLATAGSNDVAYGQSALASTTTNNNDNTAIGNNALKAVTTGINNTALGYHAANLLTVGGSNTVIGNSVGSTVLTIGSDNILIGVNNAIAATTSSASNEIHIGGTGGDWVTVTGTNTNTTESATMHGSTISFPDIASNTGAQTGYLCWAAGGITYDGTNTCLVSARKFKERIEPLKNGLAEVMKLKPVTYYYKNKKIADDKQHIGFIAEDVVQVEPRLVGYDGKGEIHSVNYEQMAPLFALSIQEIVDNDKKKFEAMQKEIDSLKSRLAKHK